jgi:hypothetical protein
MADNLYRDPFADIERLNEGFLSMDVSYLFQIDQSIIIDEKLEICRIT